MIITTRGEKPSLYMKISLEPKNAAARKNRKRQSEACLKRNALSREKPNQSRLKCACKYVCRQKTDVQIRLAISHERQMEIWKMNTSRLSIVAWKDSPMHCQRKIIFASHCVHNSRHEKKMLMKKDLPKLKPKPNWFSKSAILSEVLNMHDVWTHWTPDSLFCRYTMPEHAEHRTDSTQPPQAPATGAVVLFKEQTPTRSIRLRWAYTQATGDKLEHSLYHVEQKKPTVHCFSSSKIYNRPNSR